MEVWTRCARLMKTLGGFGEKTLGVISGKAMVGEGCGKVREEMKVESEMVAASRWLLGRQQVVFSEIVVQQPDLTVLG